MELQKVSSHLCRIGLFVLLVNIFSYGIVFAQHVEILYNVYQTESLGSIVRIHCSSEILRGANQAVRWEFEDGRILAENARLMDADNMRYNVTDKGQFLFIQNAIKADEGLFTCHIYDSSTNRITMSTTRHIPIESYLPPAEYPLCAITPTLTFTNGDNITFHCTTGEASDDAGIKLQLLLKRPHGSFVSVGSEATIRKMTSEDDASIFMCQMTSTTFPTFLKQCTAGPITLKRLKTSTPGLGFLIRTTKSVTINKSEELAAKEATRKFVTPRPVSKPRKENVGLQLGLVFGAIFLLFFFIIIYYSESEKRGVDGAGTNNKNDKRNYRKVREMVSSSIRWSCEPECNAMLTKI